MAIMAALPSVVHKHTREEIYRVYVTDALKAIAENTSRGNSVSKMNKRYYDAITVEKRPTQKKSGEQIAADVILGAGLKVVDK